jgi:phosphate transport system substrate-binding protein
VNKAPNKPLQPLEREFVRMMLSKQGQEVVAKDGYIPLPAAMAAKTLKDLGIE